MPSRTGHIASAMTTASVLLKCSVSHRRETPVCSCSSLLLSERSAGDAHASNYETISRFSSDPGEFFRIGHDADRLNLSLLDFNAQHEEPLSAHADDQRGLAV